MQYNIEEIAKITNAKVFIADDNEKLAERKISWLLTDSRSLCFPEETLFFALKSQRNDGHKYIEELYARGVNNFIVQSTEGLTHLKNACLLVVKNSLQALQDLATYHRQRFDIPVVAITGSNGKTTVKEWLYQILSNDYNVCRSPRSYNSQVGVPLSVWLIDRHTEIAIIEAGISQPGEMDRLNRIIKPNIGVITNIGQAHQENFLSLEIKCTEKMAILKGCTTAIMNMSNGTISHCAPTLSESINQLTWNNKSNARFNDNGLIVNNIEKKSNKAVITYSINKKEGQYTIPFIDDAAIENSVTCFTTCLALGLDTDVIAKRMETLEPVAMRMEVKDGINGCTIINDTYNSDIHSLNIALDFMARRPDTKEQRRTLILSDILQSGESARSLYTRVAEMAINKGIDKIIGVGEKICQCADYFRIDDKYFFRTTDDLISSSVFKQLKNEFILIKGARQFHFDKISDILTLKVHQTILEVNLNAMVDNLNYYRQFKKPETKMVCMVKASAYGIGSVEASKTLQDHGVDYLAVAVADEGAELRNAGITANIMVMNPEMTSFKMLFDYRLEPEVFNFEILEALIRAAEKEGITNFPIHIKIDTGMHRLGFNAKTDMERLTKRLLRQTAVVPCSVFSHFVGSDSDEFDEFSHQQFKIFDQASSYLQKEYGHKIMRHICNSAAIEHFPQYHLDMVRLGLGLYGINPRNNEIIHNVCTLKTTILQVRDVPAGDSIGYSRKTFVDRPSRVADIPIGYADGLNRHLGNRNCYCLVNGKKANYLGNICMDVCMIDVTDIDCKAGDHAIIFGDELPVTVLSDVLDTIPYEVLTGISTRVQRVYTQE